MDEARQGQPGFRDATVAHRSVPNSSATLGQIFGRAGSFERKGSADSTMGRPQVGEWQPSTRIFAGWRLTVVG